MDVVFCPIEAWERAGKKIDELNELFPARYGEMTFVERAGAGRVKGIRLSTLAELCDKLDCEPGDLFKRVPSEPVSQ